MNMLNITKGYNYLLTLTFARHSTASGVIPTTRLRTNASVAAIVRNESLAWSAWTLVYQMK